MKRILIASAALALLSLASGCGLKGSLERPAPMWGSERSRYLEEQRQAEAAKETKKPLRPHVDIPVESDGTTPATQTAPAATEAKAGAGTSSAVKSDGSPDISQSGGAVPPVDPVSRQRSGY